MGLEDSSDGDRDTVTVESPFVLNFTTRTEVSVSKVSGMKAHRLLGVDDGVNPPVKSF